ncbi:collagenase-like [Neocloeon triangulifer]|uniref:collagenase-like n=1 Tax=Neocloeon triangulifer TaxID=2078957 RepID=UPI00286EDA2F|nr:collagenase-like [Neocloeon triangulifer]
MAVKLSCFVFLIIVLITQSEQQALSKLKMKGFTKPARPTTQDEIIAYMKNPANTPKIDFKPTGTYPQTNRAGFSEYHLAPQILGGTNASQRQFPWVAFMVMDGSSICNGAVISADWILTTANCVYGVDEFEIYVGGVDTDVEEKFEQIVFSDYYYRHPDFDTSTYENDIALVPVNLTFNDYYYPYIRPICLPKLSQTSNSFNKVSAVLAGYGDTVENSATDGSRFMQYVTLRTVNNAVCVANYGSSDFFSTNICTGPHPTKAPCDNDDGAPLMYRDSQTGRYTVIGLYSFGSSSSCDNRPVAYTRVSSFLGWISQVTNLAIRP